MSNGMTIKRADYIENRDAERRFEQIAQFHGWDDRSKAFWLQLFISQSNLMPHLVDYLRARGIEFPVFPAKLTAEA